MATSGLLALLDDITMILDDVAAMSKIAVKKTAGIAGDDLAVGAQSMIGIDPNRELPIVGKVFMGSMANKAILIPIALALPTAAITPLLMAGGAFLCYEALHKMMHKKDAKDEEHHQKMLEAIIKGPEDLIKVENKKVWQAIGTDTVLSAEIIAVSLGAVAAAPLVTKAAVLTLVGVGMTIGVYGLVAGIVKLDDLGLHLQKDTGKSGLSQLKRRIGRGLVDHTPKFMKLLGIVGTAAMLLVGGGIIAHGIPVIGHAIESAGPAVSSIPFVQGLVNMAATGLFGIVAGIIAMPAFIGAGKVLGKVTDKAKSVYARKKK